MRRFNGALYVFLVLSYSLVAFAADPPTAYVSHCASCHAVDGSGRVSSAIGKIPDLRSKAIANLSDEELFKAIAYGNVHKAYAHSFIHTGVSEPEIRGIVEYMRALQRSPRNTAANQTGSHR